MAYLDATLPRDRATTAYAAGFSPVEWRVIEIARHDNHAAIGSRGWQTLARLLGLRTAAPLADRQLEALRRAALRYWRTGNAVEQAENEALIAVGYSMPQIALLAHHIGANR